MKGPALYSLLLAILVASPLTCCVSATTAAENPVQNKEPISAKHIRAKLGERVTLEHGIDANTPLQEALELLSSQLQLPIIIDTKAFEEIQIQKVEDWPVRLPKMKEMRVRTVLSMLLKQIKGDNWTGTFMVRDDHLEVTTNYHALSEILGGELGRLFQDGVGLPPLDAQGNPVKQGSTGHPRAILAIVHADFENRPLYEAVKELGDIARLNVIIDPRVAEKAKAPVTATLNNVLIDTAMKVVLDMGGLKVVRLDNVFYVTTPENARAIESEPRPKGLDIPGVRWEGPAPPPPFGAGK